MSYVNCEDEYGDRFELVLGTDRDQTPFVTVEISDEDSSRTLLVMPAEVPALFEAFEKLKADWERETRDG